MTIIPAGADPLLYLHQFAGGGPTVVFELQGASYPVDGLVTQVINAGWAGVTEIRIVGGGPSGYTQLELAPSAWFHVTNGVRLVFERIRLLCSGSSPAGSEVLLVGPRGALAFANCFVDADGDDVPPSFVHISGARSRFEALGLKIFGFRVGVRVSKVQGRVPGDQPRVTLTSCGVADADIGIDSIDAGSVVLEDSVFQECEVGVRLQYSDTLVPVTVQGCWFHECSTGLIVAAEAPPDPFGSRVLRPVWDRGPSLSPGAPPYRVPSPSGLAGGSEGPPLVSIERNEFRAPGRSANSRGVVSPTTVAAVLSLLPSTTALVHVRENVIHLCDNGLRVFSRCRVLIDHNTFVAVRHRAISVADVLLVRGLAITANLFIGAGVRPDLGLPQGGLTAPFAAALQTGFVAVHFDSGATRVRSWVGANVFQGMLAGDPITFGPDASPGDIWASSTTLTPDGHVSSWSNSVVPTADCVVLRLPRWRVSEDDLVFVRFDYHIKEGAPGAGDVVRFPVDFDSLCETEPAPSPRVPGASSPLTAGDPRAMWLDSHGFGYTQPARDFYGEEIGFHQRPWPVGAARAVPAWQQFPLISYGFLGSHDDEELPSLFDAFSYGAAYSPGGSAVDPAWVDLTASFGIYMGGPTPSRLERAEQWEMGIVLAVPYLTWRNGPPLEHEGLSLPKAGADPQIEGALVDYWAPRAARFISGLAECDVNERIYLWTVQDELPTNLSNLALAALARELVVAEDPLRRGVASHQVSVNTPMWGGLSTMTAFGATTPIGPSSGEGPVSVPQPQLFPEWADPKASIDFFQPPEGDRVYVGSLTPSARPETCIVEQDDGYQRLSTLDCHRDWGVFGSQQLGDRGAPTWVNDHSASSWQMASDSSDLATSNRSFVSQQAHIQVEQTELAWRLETLSLSQSPAPRMAFHNPGHPVTPGADLPSDEGLYRFDFWAGLHHAEAIWLYTLGGTDRSPGSEAIWRAASEGLTLLKGTGAGAGLREAMANGEKAQGLRVDSPPPYWMPGLSVSAEAMDKVDFGAPGSTPAGLSSLIWTAWRHAGVTWLIVTNSLQVPTQDPPVIVMPEGASATFTNLTPSSSAVLDIPSVSVTFPGIDAIALRIE